MTNQKTYTEKPPTKAAFPKPISTKTAVMQKALNQKKPALVCTGHEHDNPMLVQEALAAIPEDELIFSATEIFSALADSTRFRILSALSAGQLCVSDLLCATSVSQSAVSHQLRFLRDKRLVCAQREGQRVVYSLADDHVKSLIELALEHAAE
jgi:DNA-binding transcriptional ArsR family regulator